MSGITNRWFDNAPAETVKGNDASSEAQVKDLTVSELINLIGPSRLIAALPDAELGVSLDYVIVQQSGSYVATDYVVDDYLLNAAPSWVKMRFTDFYDWLNSYQNPAYVNAGYVETGYITE